MKVIFKRLENISKESRDKEPVLVNEMEPLFDGVTVREIKKYGKFIYDMIDEPCWSLHPDWFYEVDGYISEFKEIVDLFEL